MMDEKELNREPLFEMVPKRMVLHVLYMVVRIAICWYSQGYILCSGAVVSSWKIIYMYVHRKNMPRHMYNQAFADILSIGWCMYNVRVATQLRS